MSQMLQKELEELTTHSAWMFDETILLLTGSTADQIRKLRAETKLPKDPISYPELKVIKMLATEVGNRETKAYNIPFLEGKTYTIPNVAAQKWIEKGSAEELNKQETDEWTRNVDEQKKLYLKIQDQCQLVKNLERAVQDGDIESPSDIDSLQPIKWRLNKTSVLRWVHTNEEKVYRLRHFPNNIDDILVNELQLFKETRPTTDKPVVKPERTTPISPLDAKIQPEPVVNVFRNDGEIWIIIFNEKELPKITDVKGLSYVQHALMNPDEIIPNKQIEGHFDESDSSEIDGSGFAAGNSSEKMDPDTYRAIMEEKDIKNVELEKNLKQGKLDNIELENEIEKIEKYLSQNTYQGRIKEFTNEDIRSSDRIRAAIKTAIDKINEHDSSLAKLLKSSIKTSPTGTRYTPIPGIAPWER